MILGKFLLESFSNSLLFPKLFNDLSRLYASLFGPVLSATEGTPLLAVRRSDQK